jgi:hypothetical protein
LFLNGLPYAYRWIAAGGLPNLGASLIFSAATTAVHHFTTLFGAIMFIAPIGLHALHFVARAKADDIAPAGAAALGPLARFVPALRRGFILSTVTVAAIVVVIFPYWLWSITDPITQVPIPHGSREDFLSRTDFGVTFFLLPWGVMLLALPYAFYKAATSRLWPLGAALALCLLLGTGGTTPLPRVLLGNAYEILTFDRFTFWATILALPFLGLMFESLIHGRSGRLIAMSLGPAVRHLITIGSFVSAVVVATFVAILPELRPTQPDFVDPTPIVRFMESDNHDRWRYLTLGLGDQFAYVSALMEAQTVDGNYHSARRLPDLSRYSVERLENAKYQGVPGIGSLRQFILNADSYHLKYVFSNDEFYDPLLFFGGWTRLNRLENGIVVWERADVTPIPNVEQRRDVPPVLAIMWGTFPPVSLVLAASVLIIASSRRRLLRPPPECCPVLVPQAGTASEKSVRWVAAVITFVSVAGIAAYANASSRSAYERLAPEAVISGYFTDLDFRRFESAWERLDPQTRLSFEDAMFEWRWTGGLIASFGKLLNVSAMPVEAQPDIIDWEVTLNWLTALDVRTQSIRIRTVRRNQGWFVMPTQLRMVQSPVRLDRIAEIEWTSPGRRQPRPETDLYQDRLDRPEITVAGVRLVRFEDRLWLVGQTSNPDADPALISLIGDLRTASGNILARQGADTAGGQRLLPGESAGFRIGFEAILPLTDARPLAGFDPMMLQPPVFDQPVDHATLEARALVETSHLYRGVSLNAVRAEEIHNGLRLSGLAVNSGAEIASIVRVGVLLYDENGMPRWADAGFVEPNIYPGQSAEFVLELPLAADIAVISELQRGGIWVNGVGPDEPEYRFPSGLEGGTIPLDGLAGWNSIRLSVTSMVRPDS